MNGRRALEEPQPGAPTTVPPCRARLKFAMLHATRAQGLGGGTLLKNRSAVFLQTHATEEHRADRSWASP